MGDLGDWWVAELAANEAKLAELRATPNPTPWVEWKIEGAESSIRTLTLIANAQPIEITPALVADMEAGRVDFAKGTELHWRLRRVIGYQMTKLVKNPTPAPATQREFAEIMNDLLHLPMRKSLQEDATAIMRTYLKYLSDLPKPALEQAVQTLATSESWFPSIAQIREAAAGWHPGFTDESRILCKVRDLLDGPL